MTEPRQLTKEELIELGATPETGELDLPTLARLRLAYVEARLVEAERLLDKMTYEFEAYAIGGQPADYDVAIQCRDFLKRRAVSRVPCSRHVPTAKPACSYCNGDEFVGRGENSEPCPKCRV